MIHIGEDQVREALPMVRAIELVEESFRRLSSGQARNHPRRRIPLANGAMLHAMEAGDNESQRFAAKLYATRPGAGAHFAVVLFDAETTNLLATIDADLLGQIRTGAASGVSARHMAREDAAVLGMIGAGWQAQSQLEAIASVRKLREARVFSRSPQKRLDFCRRMSERLGLDITAVESARAAAAGADLVVTVTNAKSPVLLGEWIEPGCHICAAGSNHAQRRELDAEAVERAAVIAADSVEQAKIEAGDLIQAASEGRFDWSRVVEFSEIAAGRAVGRGSPGQVTLFESQGLAAEDLAVADWVYRQVSGRAA